MERRIEAVLFDKDGTLMDFQSSWGPWAHAMILDICAEDGEKAQGVAQSLGFDLDAQRFDPDSPVIAGTPDEVVALLRPHFPEATDALILDWLTPVPEAFRPAPVEGLAQCCASLREKGVRLALVTNDFAAAAEAHLGQMGVSEHFEAVIGYDSGYGGKPAPEPCLGAAARLGVPPEACVMVGDSLHDLAAGAAAGMLCVGVLTGVAGAEELRPHAAAVLDSVTSLEDWLSRGAD